MRIAVAICSINRAGVLADTLPWLARQTLTPSEVLLVVTAPADLPPEEKRPRQLNLRIAYAPKGLTCQRNHAINMLKDRCDALLFIDDDFIPSKFALEGVSETFAHHRNVNGVTGLVLADGVGRGGITLSQAAKHIARSERSEPHKKRVHLTRRSAGLYGCNMAFRTTAIGDCRFDETLPLYGWQEDVDFSNRIDGENIQTNAFEGVHLGTRLGRETNGRALGYSQVANVIYLMRKGSMSWRHGLVLMGRNLCANIVRALRPEPWIDRRGRMKGNWVAIRDFMNGTLAPGNILKSNET